MATDWLGIQQWAGAFGRRLVAERYFDRLQQEVKAGLLATYGEGGASPDTGKRANCFEVLARRGDFAAISDGVGWFDEILPVFVEAGETPGLSDEHAALFFASLGEDARTRLRQLLEDEIANALTGTGRFASYKNALPVLARLSGMLGS